MRLLGLNSIIILLILCLSLAACQSVPEVKDKQREQDFSLRGQNLIMQGRYGDAVAELNEGLKLEPNSPQLVQQMGRALALNKNYSEAEKYLQRAARLDPNDSNTYGYFGMMYRAQKKYKEALDSNLTAHNLIPEDPYYYYEIGQCYNALGDGRNAVKYFSMYLKDGDNPTLKRLIVKGMRSSKIDIPPFESHVVALLEEKKFSESEEFLQGLKNSKQVDANGDSELSIAYRDIRNMENARDILLQWRQANQKSAFASGLLGAVFIDYAWEARGNGFITSVTTSAAATFEERLKQGNYYLLESRKLDPSNLQTVHDLMLIAKANRSTRIEVGPLFDSITSQEPDTFLLQKQMLDALTPKWGGTVNEMFEFSRNQASKSPQISKAPILIPMAHWEIALAYYYQNPAAYFSKKSVWDECKKALDQAVQRFPKSVEIRTLYLRTAYFAGDLAAARTQYELVKDQTRLKYWAGGYTELMQVKRALR